MRASGADDCPENGADDIPENDHPPENDAFLPFIDDAAPGQDHASGSSRPGARVADNPIPLAAFGPEPSVASGQRGRRGVTSQPRNVPHTAYAGFGPEPRPRREDLPVERLPPPTGIGGQRPTLSGVPKEEAVLARPDTDFALGHGDAERELPPGFGALVLEGRGRPRAGADRRGIRCYPLGHQGRFVRLENTSLSDTDGIGNLLAAALPPGDQRLADAVRRGTIAFIRGHGRHEFTRRLLDGTLTIPAGGADGRVLTFALDLGDLRQARHARGVEREPVPIGTKRHHAVEADQQAEASVRRGAGSDHGLTVTLNALAPFGSLLPDAFSLTLGGAVSGSSGASYTNGHDVVTAAKRAPRYEHLSAYFDFPDASLRVVVSGGAAAPLPARVTRLTARAAFPEETAPAKSPGDPPGAFRDPPRALPGSRVLGISQRDLLEMPDRSRRAEAEQALDAVLGHFLHMPEAAGDLSDLREQVLATLSGAGEADPKVDETLRGIFGEPWFLKRYGDIVASGALSPLVTDSSGRALGYLKIKAAPRTARAAVLGNLGLKEEVQRFVSGWDQEALSGGAGITLTGQGSRVFGDPSAPLGGNSQITGSVALTAPVSSTRSQNINIGSGDIRGAVIWGDSVVYLADFHATVELIPMKGQRRPPFEGSLLVILRIPQLERDRFEYLFDRATGAGGTAAEPVDDEPDATRSERYPPAVMAAGQGIGFAGALHLPGSEQVLPKVMELIKKAERPLAWASASTPAAEAILESQLAAWLSSQALKAHASALFQPGGIRAVVYRPAEHGTEAISVTVSASHDFVITANGRVAKTTLEVMPSAFAGNQGTDTITAGMGGYGQVAGAGGLGARGRSTIGGRFEVGGQRTYEAGTTAGATGFTLQAMLYGPGPARYFRYGHVSYDITVQARWEGGAAHVASGSHRPFRRLGVESDRTLRGSVTFIMHEALTRSRPEPPQLVATVGKVAESHDGRPPQRDDGRLSEVQVPSLAPYLGGDEVAFDYVEDQLMEVLGAQHISAKIDDMLRDLGITDSTIGDLPQVISGACGSALVRGGAVNKYTLVQSGRPWDRHVVITVEGTLAALRRDNPDTVTLFQMHVAEGSAIAGSSTSVTQSVGFAVSVPTQTLGRTDGGGSWSASYGHAWGWGRGETFNLTPTTGRLTQATNEYVEHTADMVWLITAVAYDKNIAWSSLADYRTAVIKVNRGINFLRREIAAPDPRDLPSQRPGEDVVALIGRQPVTPPAAAGPRTRMVPTLRATTRPGDTRRVPLVPLLPPSAVHDKLFPARKEQDGKGNPVLDAVDRLLREHAPELLDEHFTVRDGQRAKTVSARLHNVLTLASLSTLIDVVLGPGLVLDATLSYPGGNWRYQIVLRGRRDPHGTGLAWLGTVDGMNTVRYATMLQTRNRTWSSMRGGKVADGGPAGGMALTGGGTGGSDGPGAVLDDVEGSITPSITQTTVRGGYEQWIKAARNTRFEPGKAHFYGSDLTITASVTRTWVPSRLVNSMGANLPHYIASWLQRADNQRLSGASTKIRLMERVIIPHSQIHAETLPPTPARNIAAVEEVKPDDSPGQVLNVSPRQILDREVLPLGFDHEKLQVLFDEVLAKLAGNELPLTGDRSHAVSRLIEHGTRARDAMYDIFSYALFTGNLDQLLSAEGARMPILFREGGPVTDTYGWITVKVRFTDPHLLGWFRGWVEAVNYGFEEFQEYEARTSGISLGLGGGATLNTGRPGANLSPASPASWQLAALADATVGQQDTRQSSGTMQMMTRYDAVNRAIPRLRVSADAIITVEAEAENRRDWLIVPIPGLEGGKVVVHHRVRHAVELGFSPDAAISADLHHRDGIPVSSGTFFPAPGASEDRLRAAYLLPYLTRAFAVQLDLSDGEFLIGGRPAAPRVLAEAINHRLSELTAAPPPDLPAEERPPPAPRRLEGPDDPVILAAPRAAVPLHGRAAPAQQLADVLQRPVIAPDTGYLITRAGTVRAVNSGRTARRAGNWFVFQPSDEEGSWSAIPLPSRLDDALATARRKFGWAAEIAGLPGQDAHGVPAVPAPAHDVYVAASRSQAEAELVSRVRRLFGPGVEDFEQEELIAVMRLTDRLRSVSHLRPSATELEFLTWLREQIQESGPAAPSGRDERTLQAWDPELLRTFGLLNLAAYVFGEDDAGLDSLRSLSLLTGLARQLRWPVLGEGAGWATERLAAALRGVLPGEFSRPQVSAAQQVRALARMAAQALGARQPGGRVTHADLRSATPWRVSLADSHVVDQEVRAGLSVDAGADAVRHLARQIEVALRRDGPLPGPGISVEISVLLLMNGDVRIAEEAARLLNRRIRLLWGAAGQEFAINLCAPGEIPCVPL